ncbi:MAG: hypothetical protein ACYC2Z_04885, partial [Candidatus Nanopelagicales bacterium]
MTVLRSMRGRGPARAALGGAAAALVTAAMVVVAPPSHAAGESLGVEITVIGDSQLQFGVCLTSGDSLPARLTGSYTVTQGGSTVASGNWWTTDSNVTLIGTESCPSPMAGASIGGLALATGYTVTVNATLDPRIETSDGDFVADG